MSKTATAKPRAAKQSPAEQIVKINKQELKLTNLTKLYFPKDKISKGDVIAYYDSIAPVLLPYLKNRPMSLKRNPNGIDAPAFYHKDAGEQAPDWIDTYDVYAESSNKVVNYIVCNNKATLLYLANLGCIEMNPWNSTVNKPDNPSYLIIDIDPSKKNTFDQVISVAQATQEVLNRAGAVSYCKTSGASGLHVYLPLNARYPYELAREFAEIVATLVHEQLQGITSIERSLSKRGNKIYVDYLQNSRGQTLASAYSLRPEPGATVSAPLLWKEVKAGLHPSQFTIFNIESRVKKLGDIFYMVLKKGNDLRHCLKNLGY
ncbi:MAG: non-homologous end-joining DNA ligase [Candidatus Pseudobacter hemicellulosilyticus]|uniref:Non-homologous end-joining DNA ligase n=1 Tax=Candidatus Pseudobacter hemicellulosilyticus TaxID=3121375 RepID=A0AAJ5WMS7_9BACT|nr:MAG: non-homologous end-joining DNA ligase [Pseudobacter sp.]